MSRKIRIDQLIVLPQALRWLCISVPIAILAGSASALLLYSLDAVTRFRDSHVWIIALLPVSGFLIGSMYHYFGKEVEAGTNLIFDEIHDPNAVISARMTPFIFIGTVVAHLFGGSVGREGTAVQMGASLADRLSGPLKLTPEDRRIILMAGMSAGFASVFGTPLAGAVFGLEVLFIGRIRYSAIWPCFISAVLAHRVTLLWGIHHTENSVGLVPAITVWGVLLSLFAGAIFGTMGAIFAALTHWIDHTFKRFIDFPPLRLVVGGVMVAVAVWALGTTRYIGLGIPVIDSSFTGIVHPWDFALKTLFTSLTLGSGFKGGEVTPLFYIGATLGNALGSVLPLPRPLLAGMGFAAVFAGAANTPLASMLMAIELFGAQGGVYLGLACVSAYIFSGHAGIYESQRIGFSKHPGLGGEQILDSEAFPSEASSSSRTSMPPSE